MDTNKLYELSISMTAALESMRNVLGKVQPLSVDGMNLHVLSSNNFYELEQHFNNLNCFLMMLNNDVIPDKN